jgi:Lon-like protease
VRRLFVVLVLLALVGVGLAFVRGDVPCDVLAAQPACEVAMRPGPTEDAFGLVSVEGARAYPSEGQLRLTTVAVDDDLTLRAWLRAHTSDVIEAVPRERVFPPGLDRDEVAEQNAALMADSQLVATIVALESVGYELEGDGALVAAVTEQVVTDELEVGDVIVAVDGHPVEESVDVVEAVQAREPGDPLNLDVLRDGRARSIELTLGSVPEDPEIAFIGVLLTTDLDLPVDVDIDAGLIGGPSAGLVFTLSIIDLLGEEDLTGGAVVAGTGTVERDGTVGAVGGVRQKVYAASAGTGGDPAASVFLVPRGNLADARQATVADDLLVVPVDTVDDALLALGELRAGREPAGALAIGPDR